MANKTYYNVKIIRNGQRRIVKVQIIDGYSTEADIPKIVAISYPNSEIVSYEKA